MLLEIHNLAKRYDCHRGLAPISLSVGSGELIAIVGHNGAGKSTLLKLLASWMPPDEGSMLIEGIDSRHRSAVVKKIGFIPEVPNLFEFFSVEYNLTLFASLLNTPLHRVETLLGEFKLTSHRKTKVQALSKGLKQRVSIARALLANPSVLLLDEPTSGLDFETTRDIYLLLGAMHRAGKTIIFTSHRPEEIKGLATRILLLHEGNLAFDGSTQDYFQSAPHAQLYAWQ